MRYEAELGETRDDDQRQARMLELVSSDAPRVVEREAHLATAFTTTTAKAIVRCGRCQFCFGYSWTRPGASEPDRFDPRPFPGGACAENHMYLGCLDEEQRPAGYRGGVWGGGSGADDRAGGARRAGRDEGSGGEDNDTKIETILNMKFQLAIGESARSSKSPWLYKGRLQNQSRRPSSTRCEETIRDDKKNTWSEPCLVRRKPRSILTPVLFAP